MVSILIGTQVYNIHWSIITKKSDQPGYTNAEQQKCLSKLVGFKFQIIYLPRKSNQVADALSRPSYIVLLVISSRNYELEKELKSLNQLQAKLLDSQKQLEGQTATYLGYVFRDGLLFFRGWLVIISDFPLLSHTWVSWHYYWWACGVAPIYHRLPSNFY